MESAAIRNVALPSEVEHVERTRVQLSTSTVPSATASATRHSAGVELPPAHSNPAPRTDDRGPASQSHDPIVKSSGDDEQAAATSAAEAEPEPAEALDGAATAAGMLSSDQGENLQTHDTDPNAQEAPTAAVSLAVGGVAERRREIEHGMRAAQEQLQSAADADAQDLKFALQLQEYELQAGHGHPRLQAKAGVTF